MKKILFIIFTIPIGLLAQDSNKLGGIFDFNKSIRMNHNWSLKSKGQARFELPKENDLESEKRLDLQSVIQRNFFANKTIAIGAMYRFQKNVELLRLIQQFSIVHKLERMKLAHRFRLDESINTMESTSVLWRLRYRFGIQFTLDGFQLNDKENYFLPEVEFLSKHQSNISSLELRLGAAYGYVYKSSNRGELGLDYRLLDMGNADQEKQLWLVLAFFI